MARLVGVYRENEDELLVRQLPLIVDDALAFVMQCDESISICDSIHVKQRELEAFTKKYNLLQEVERTRVLAVTTNEVLRTLAQAVPCVGCRRSVERLLTQLVQSQFPSLDPLVVTADSLVTLNTKCICNARFLCSLFTYFSHRLDEVLDSIPKTKKNRRCLLHSLEIQKLRVPGSWREVWDSMNMECREELVLIETELLMETLDNYLRKHRFCSECKAKVMRAYSIMVGEIDPETEKGFVKMLYNGIRTCHAENHIHVQADAEFIAHLMDRAEPELRGGSRREKHAKTMEVAQEEVLTCVAICLWERLQRIWQKMRQEEQTWQLLFYLCLKCLRKNFDLAVEEKQGVSQLELVCEEICQMELAKQQRRETRRQKRRRRKDRLRSTIIGGSAGDDDDKCECPIFTEDFEEELPVVDGPAAPSSSSSSSPSPSPCPHSGKQSSRIAGSSAITNGVTISGNNHGKSTIKTKIETPISSKGTDRGCHIINGYATCNNKYMGTTSCCSDCGYSSGNCNEFAWSSSSSSSCDNSEVACSDGLCNHECGNVTKGAPLSPKSSSSSSCLCDASPRSVSSDVWNGNARPISPGIINPVMNKGQGGVSVEKGSTLSSMLLSGTFCMAPSLQDMLLEGSCSSEEEENDEVKEELKALFPQVGRLHQERQQLRATLKQRFDALRNSKQPWLTLSPQPNSKANNGGRSNTQTNGRKSSRNAKNKQ